MNHTAPAVHFPNTSNDKKFVSWKDEYGFEKIVFDACPVFKEGNRLECRERSLISWLTTMLPLVLSMSYSSSLKNSSLTSSSSLSLQPYSIMKDNEMSFETQVIWATGFTMMLTAAIFGNIIVIWSVTAHKRMRIVTNYFLINLSLADTLMASLNGTFNFVYMLNKNWTFGKTYCMLNTFVANVTVAASVFTLTAITLDRFLAITRPLKPRMTKTKAQVEIACIWLASCIIGVPCLLYSTLKTHKSSGQTACIMEWPDGLPSHSMLDYLYNVFLFLVTYLIPMVAMVVCYTAMGRELWGSRSIGELTKRQADSIRSKRKVVLMFMLIVFTFGVCWLPYHVYFIYTHFKKDVIYAKYVQHVYLGFYWLAMSNAMFNPAIYYFMNPRFREYFRKAICEWTCFRRNENLDRLEGGETPPIRRYSHSGSKSRSGGTAEDGSGSGGRRAQHNLMVSYQKNKKECGGLPHCQLIT